MTILFKNTDNQYGVVTKSFHWAMAVLIICLLVMGLTMDSIPNGLDKMWVYGLHKSLGVTVLSLAVLRVLWHVYSKRPVLLPSLKSYEKLGAHVIHVFLYVSMVAMPVSGWFMSSAFGRTVSFFGLFTLPDFVEKNEPLARFLADIHETWAWCLITAVVLHFLAALKHHFINKDKTLRRMIPFGEK